MSADVTSQEDLDDLAFRALLEPLALEVLPGRSPKPAAETAEPVAVAPEIPPEVETSAEPAELAASDPPQPAAWPAAGQPEADEPEVPATTVTDVSPSGLPSPPVAMPSLTASERSPEAASPTTGAQDNPLAPPSEAAQDRSTPAVGPADLAGRPPIEAVPIARSLAPIEQVVPSASAMAGQGRWRLTVAIPDQIDGLPPPPNSPRAPPDRLSAPPSSPPMATRPVRLPAVAPAERLVRKGTSPRLVARAGTVTQPRTGAARSSQLVMRGPVLPPARVRWRVVLFAGMASAVTVVCVSWLFGQSSPADAPSVRPDAASVATSEPTTRIATPPPNPAASANAAATDATAVTPPASAPPSAAVPTHTQSASPPQAMIGLLTQRGDAALAVGDIVGARLLYERAAAMGSATAATAAGKTYDLDFLLRADTHGIRPDQEAAAAWYRKAAALGDPEARSLLGRLEAQRRP